jgi:hypothetical protein
VKGTFTLRDPRIPATGIQQAAPEAMGDRQRVVKLTEAQEAIKGYPKIFEIWLNLGIQGFRNS